MEKNTQTPTPSEFNAANGDDEIDLKDIIRRLWLRRKFIFVASGIFLLLGIFIAFASPVEYKAGCVVVPQTGQKGGGNLGGLASMMGVNLGSSMSDESLSPLVYPKIVNSVPFCKEIMETPITVKKSQGLPITLYEYYTDKQYQQKSLLQGIKKYTVGLPGVILSALRSDKEIMAYTDSVTGSVIVLTKEEREVVETIKKSIQFENNTKEGYIVLGYTFSEPEAVAEISQQLFTVLERYVKNFKAQKQLDNLQFVETSYEEARKDFMKKQANLATFQDANRGLASAMARTTERQLSSEYEVAFTVYNELAKQREQAKLAVKESTPILTVIDPVVVPNEKSEPKRGMIMVVFLFLGMVASIGWVLVKPFLKEIREGAMK